MDTPGDIALRGPRLLERYTPSAGLKRNEAQALLLGETVRNGTLSLYGMRELQREAVVELASWLDWWELRNLPPTRWHLLSDAGDRKPPPRALQLWEVARNDGDHDVWRALLLVTQRRLAEMDFRYPSEAMDKKSYAPLANSDLVQRTLNARQTLDELLTLFPVFGVEWFEPTRDYPQQSYSFLLEQNRAGPVQTDIQLLCRVVPSAPGFDDGVIAELRVQNAEKWMNGAHGPKLFDVLCSSLSGNLDQFRVRLERGRIKIIKLAAPSMDVEDFENSPDPAVLIDAVPTYDEDEPEALPEIGPPDSDAFIRGFWLLLRCNTAMKRFERAVFRVVHDMWMVPNAIQLENPHPALQDRLRVAAVEAFRTPSWLGAGHVSEWSSELAYRQIVSMRLAVVFDVDNGTFALELRQESGPQLNDVSQLLALTPHGVPMTLMLYPSKQAPSAFWAPLFYQDGSNSLYPKANLRTMPNGGEDITLERPLSTTNWNRRYTPRPLPGTARQMEFTAAASLQDGQERPSSLAPGAAYVWPQQHPQYPQVVAQGLGARRPVWFGLYLSELHPDPDVMSERCETALNIVDRDRLLSANGIQLLRVCVYTAWQRQGERFAADRTWNAEFALVHRNDGTTAAHAVRRCYGQAVAYHWAPQISRAADDDLRMQTVAAPITH